VFEVFSTGVSLDWGSYDFAWLGEVEGAGSREVSAPLESNQRAVVVWIRQLKYWLYALFFGAVPGYPASNGDFGERAMELCMD
jgi:hypothetical protein